MDRKQPRNFIIPGEWDSTADGGLSRSIKEIFGLVWDDLYQLYNREKRGTATFPAAASIAVTFTNSFRTTDYIVTLEPSVNETFWVTAIAAAGFTLNSSNAASTAVVKWKASLE